MDKTYLDKMLWIIWLPCPYVTKTFFEFYKSWNLIGCGHVKHGLPGQNQPKRRTEHGWLEENLVSGKRGKCLVSVLFPEMLDFEKSCSVICLEDLGHTSIAQIFLYTKFETGNWELQKLSFIISFISTGKYLFKVNKRSTRGRREICSRLKIKKPGRRHWRRSGVFTVSLKHILQLVPVFLLLTLNM